MNIRLTLLALLVTVSQTIYSQSFQDAINQLNNRRSEKSSVIIDALKPELSIIRQQYQLKRDGNYWGKNGKNYYGESYTLGVKVSGGMILLGEVLTPWEYDEEYQTRYASGNYTPVLYRSYQHGINDSTFHEVDWDLNTYAKPLNEGKSLYIYTDAQKDFGLNKDETAGEKKGYMIWVYSTTTVEDSVVSMYLVQSSYQVDASADSTIYRMSPENQEKLLGGIFVVPRIERGGIVQFLLVGVAAPDAARNWDLHLLTTETNPLPKENIDKHKKKEDKKRGGEPDDELTPIKS